MKYTLCKICVSLLFMLFIASCAIGVADTVTTATEGNVQVSESLQGETVRKIPASTDLVRKGSPQVPQDGTYADFLALILAGESSIDPKDAKEYYNLLVLPIYPNPSPYPNIYTSYPDVSYPGAVLRNIDGSVSFHDKTIEGYFWSIGVLDLYDVHNPFDLNMIKNMQYNVINYLGFIGYQFSESDLQVLGYYNYARDPQGHPIYYVDIDPSNWANNVHEKLMDIKQPDGSVETVLVTDVNRWGGTFTGKNGINSLADFKSDKADAIAKDHFTYKYNNIVKLLATQNKTIQDFVGKTIRWDQLSPKLTPPPGIPEEITISYSGLLAGAHLRGAQGVYNLLILHENNQDESGTAILGYLYTFGGYTTPWGK